MLVELSRLRQSRVVWSLSLGGLLHAYASPPLTGDIVAFCQPAQKVNAAGRFPSRFLRPVTACAGQMVWKMDVRQPQTSLLTARFLIGHGGFFPPLCVNLWQIIRACAELAEALHHSVLNVQQLKKRLFRSHEPMLGGLPA